MPLVLKDRVKETTTTTSTGAYTLAGAVTGYQSFSVIGDGNTTYYAVTNGTDWEVGIGTYTSSGTTLSRDTILESSNSGNAVNWGAGTKDIFVTYPAERSMYVDGTTITPAISARLGFANLAQGSALSVLGVTGNSTADNASIAAGTDNQVLRRSGTSLAFGAVNLASSDAVTGALAVTNGGTGGTSQSAARTGLGATTLGANLFTITNPSAITFPRFNADNSVSSLSDTDFRTAIGAGTGNGTVTSVGGTGTVNGITLTGSVTTSGNLTLGGTLSGVSLTTQVTGTLPIANGGTGSTATAYCSLATNVSGILPAANGGTNNAFFQVSGPATSTKTYTFPNENMTVVGTTQTQTLTNKTITQRVSSTASISSPLAFNSDNFDLYAATAQAGDLTINADAGNPTDGQKIIFRFTCDGTIRTITFTGGASKAFKPVGANLTVAGSNFTYALTVSKTTYFGCVYNTSSSRWEVVALSQEA